MAIKKFDGLAVPRGIDPDIARPFQQINQHLLELSAGPDATQTLAIAGGSVDVGSGSAPIPGQALLAQTKRKAVWTTIPYLTFSWERVDATVSGTHLVFECPSGYEWLPTHFVFRSRNSTFDASGTAVTISLGVVGGGYIDVLAATALAITNPARSQTLLPKQPAFNVQGGTQLYANISVAAAPGPAIMDVYGIGILMPT